MPSPSSLVLLSSKNSATMVTWRHTSPLYSQLLIMIRLLIAFFLVLYRWCSSWGKKTKRGGGTFQRQQKTLGVWHKADLCITECSILRTQLLRETQKATWNASCTFLSLRSQGNWTNFWLAEEFTATLLWHGTAHYFCSEKFKNFKSSDIFHIIRNVI